MSNVLEIIPLGGIGEFGMNCTLLRYGDANVVIVCHGTIIRYTLGALAGRQLPAIENGSTATFDRMGEGWRVHTVNDAVLSPLS